MAKVDNQEVPSLDTPAYRRVLKPSRRFVNVSVRRKGFFNVRKNRKNLIARSLLFEISALWRGFTSLQKSAWDSAGAVMNMSGYKAFVQDQTLRIKNSLSGTSVPSTLHQGLAGRVFDLADDDVSGFVQKHPSSYYILRKIFNYQNQYEPILITEVPTSPLTISFRYKSDMVDLGNEVAVYIQIAYKNGDGDFDYIDFDNDSLDPNTDWTTYTFVKNPLPAGTTAYEVTIYFYAEGGEFLIDNFSCFHSGQNWAKDPYCERFGEHFLEGVYDFFPSWEMLAGYGELSQESIFPF